MTPLQTLASWLGLAVVLCAGWATARAADCVLADAASAAPSGLQLLEGAASNDGIRAECEGSSLTAVRLALPAGSRETLTLLLSADAEAMDQFKLAVAGDSFPDWLGVASVDAIPSQHAFAISIELRALGDGGVASLTLSSTAPAGTRDWPLTIELQVLAEQPMFRDRFEIDPVMGQFSYRPAPQPRRQTVSRPGSAAAPIAATSTF